MKKAKRWQCKICGEKQSVLREFARGTGTFCRLQAQQLNEKKKEIDEVELNLSMSVLNYNNQENTGETSSNEIEIHKSSMCTSKWTRFVVESDKNSDESNDEDEEALEKSFKCKSPSTSTTNNDYLRRFKRSLGEKFDSRPSKIPKKICDFKDI